MVLIFIIATPALAIPMEYRVRSGDSLSRIANKFLEQPAHIYGTDGKLERVLKLNPHIKNPDLIFPGNKIILSIENSAEKVLPPSDESPLNKPPEHLSQTAPPTESASSQAHLEPFVALTLMYLKMEAEDRRNQANGSFTSELVPRLRLGLRHAISEDLKIEVSASLQQTQWSAPTTGQALEQPSPATGLRAAVEKAFSERQHLSLHGGMVQRPFSRASTISNYVFDLANVGFVGGTFDWSFLQPRGFHLGLGAGYDFLLPSKAGATEVESGHDYEISLFLRKKFSSWSLEERLFFGSSQQASELVKQTEQRVGLIIGGSYAF